MYLLYNVTVHAFSGMLLWKWKNGDHNFTVWQKLRLYNYKEGRKGLALFQIISILKILSRNFREIDFQN